MGKSKTKQYTTELLQTALVGRAISHAARLYILRKIEAEQFITNKQLSEELMLDVSTIHDHILKMIEAGIVDSEYYNKFALVYRTNHYRELTLAFCG